MARSGRSILLVLALALIAALFPAAALAQGTLVLVNPLSQSVNLNQVVTVEIKVDSVTNLYGLDLTVTFDAAKLAVQDADGNAGNGVQIASGDFPNPAHIFVAGNSADNTTGQVKYVAAILAPNPPVSGTGVMARITFKAKAAGTALVTLSNVKLSDNQASPIAATLMSGSITVVAGPGPSPQPTPGPTPVPGTGTRYTVQWGDTLSSIGRKFGVSVQAIVAANGLTNPNFIRVGQVLLIPGTGTTPPPAPGPGTTYVVKAGDTLYAIAARFGVSVQAIAAQNGIVNINYIRVGQVLVIPGGTTPPPTPPTKQHVVRAGDTIYGIAAMYGVAPWSIIVLNNLPNPNLIFPGQVLLLP